MTIAPLRRTLAMVVVAVLLMFAPVYHAICVTMASEPGPMTHAMADGSTMTMPTSPTDSDAMPTAEAGGHADPLTIVGILLIVVGVATAIVVGLRFCAGRARVRLSRSALARRSPQRWRPPRQRARAPVDLTALSICRT